MPSESIEVVRLMQYCVPDARGQFHENPPQSVARIDFNRCSRELGICLLSRVGKRFDRLGRCVRRGRTRIVVIFFFSFLLKKSYSNRLRIKKFPFTRISFRSVVNVEIHEIPREFPSVRFCFFFIKRFIVGRII